jgi:predicted  nucleic acid-binding Zn-ribbon protein
MTDFDAEQWLRNTSIHDITEADLNQCADELAQAKAQIEKLESDLMLSGEKRIELLDQLTEAKALIEEQQHKLDYDLEQFQEYNAALNAEQGISRKLYEALKGEWNADANEAIAQYEGRK